jgi:hypothetical protein
VLVGRLSETNLTLSLTPQQMPANARIIIRPLLLLPIDQYLFPFRPLLNHLIINPEGLSWDCLAARSLLLLLCLLQRFLLEVFPSDFLAVDIPLAAAPLATVPLRSFYHRPFDRSTLPIQSLQRLFSWLLRDIGRNSP